MKPFWKIVAVVIGVAVIGGAVITWQVHERRLAEAARVCRASAERGDAEAQFRLGSIYSHGQGVTKDYSEALSWYRKSADQGNAEAEYCIGSLYFYGHGVQQDFAEAHRWAQKAADQNFATAQFALGIDYYHGYGVPQSNEEAARWYRKAADQRHASAQYNLGRMYYYGYGVPQDRAEANRWYHKAADLGDEYAQRFLGLKGPRLSTFGVFVHTIIPVGCLILLIGSLSSGGRHQTPNNRALTYAVLLGLTSEGLSLYWVFGSFSSLSAVYIFFFFKNLLAGIFVAMLIFLVLPKITKIALVVLGILFIGLNVLLLFVIFHSKQPIPVRAFCTVDGMFIGVLFSLAVFLWRSHKNAGNEPDSPCEDAVSEDSAA
jgi:hypothetical protein